MDLCGERAGVWDLVVQMTADNSSNEKKCCQLDVVEILKLSHTHNPQIHFGQFPHLLFYVPKPSFYHLFHSNHKESTLSPCMERELHDPPISRWFRSSSNMGFLVWGNIFPEWDLSPSKSACHQDKLNPHHIYNISFQGRYSFHGNHYGEHFVLSVIFTS